MVRTVVPHTSMGSVILCAVSKYWAGRQELGFHHSGLGGVSFCLARMWSICRWMNEQNLKELCEPYIVAHLRYLTDVKPLAAMLKDCRL